ncbi:hypothetical protein NEOLEDRAFT_1167291 [Neolentinus lepideus HHB14362 ss-1]|uniref:Uncharacterized protein n=1 Tax=Neolentinus lepideus HHB14362 ss-1 TaxID=1314782 RepID=A0A165UW43_9AGAM|nr:hypothetical protein NEOLEDRAFT_1167291 [Neolentinus lepideus HHB14362 ss-1]
MDLGDIPEHILLNIFESACTDGGATGAALSATSHEVAELSAGYRYQSIALSGVDQLEAFINSPGPKQRVPLNIQHLFLCDRERKRASDRIGYPRAVTKQRATKKRERAKQRYADRAEKDADDALKFADGLKRILGNCRNSLRTLTVVLFNPTDSTQSEILNHLWSWTYPELTDLSLRLCDTRQFPKGLGFQATLLPALERLHFASATSLMVIAPDWDEPPTEPMYTETQLVRFLREVGQIASLSCIRLSDVKGTEWIEVYLAKLLNLRFPADTSHGMPPAYLMNAVPKIEFRFPTKLRIGLQIWNGVGRAIRESYGFLPLKLRKIAVEKRQFLADVIELRRTERDLYPNEPRVSYLGAVKERSYDVWMNEWLERQQTESGIARELMLVPDDEDED